VLRRHQLVIEPRSKAAIALDKFSIRAVKIGIARPALGEVSMFRRSTLSSAAGVCLSLLSFAVVAQSSQEEKQPPTSSSPSWHNPAKYNPMKLIHRRPKSANEQLAANDELEIRLTTQLQAHGVLAKTANLQDACSSFKALADCIAVLHASHELKIELACLKWDVTGTKSSSVSNSCAGPSDGKAMSLRKSIALLKPDSDAKTEAERALTSAQNDIKDASS
jgi:hypothetical protein